MKQIGKRLCTWLLVFVMVLSIMPAALAEGENSSNLLSDGSFESDIWGDSPWTFDVPDWDSNTTVTWSTGAAKDGAYSVNYWSESAKTITVSQSVALAAGTYTLTGSDQGADGTFQLFAGDTDGSEVELSGWGTWDDSTLTFEAAADGVYSVGAKLACRDGGWGYLDDLRLTAVADDGEEEGYVVNVTADPNENLAAGDTVTLNISVKNNGKAVTDLAAAGLNLTTWLDYYEANGHGDGNNDAEIAAPNALSTAVTLPSAGVYYLVTELYDSEWAKLASYTTTLTVAAGDDASTSVNAGVDVQKVSGLADRFIMGVDISSVIAELESGVTYQDFDGNVIDDVTGFCQLLAESGVTHVRVRVWNDPKDGEGNSYGGGHNDVATAVEIAEGCKAAGLKLLVDFHCSDFWTDPSKQRAPKAWADYSLEEKANALQDFLTDALAQIASTGADIDMVQVGNETNSGFIGESGTANMCTLFSAGAEAVRAFDNAIQVVIHVTNPEKSTMTTWAKNLDTYGVDYDILATSYYPYWHGTLANLKSQLEAVQNTYGKDVMVVETSYAFSWDDTDGHGNTVAVGNNDTVMTETAYPYTVQGQASFLRDLIDTVNRAGGLGVYYWEPAWITVGDTTGLTGDEYQAQVAANRETWETYGSGWASSFSGEYGEDEGTWHGGSAVDNQALFAANGEPLDSLNIWNYVRTGAVNTNVTVESMENPAETIEQGGSYTLPETVAVTYNKGTVQEPVVWDAAEIDTGTVGTYTVSGTVTLNPIAALGLDETVYTYSGAQTASVVYTLTVKAVNLIGDDWSFENGPDNFSGLESTGKGIDGETPYDGSYCLHWYLTNAGTAVVTYDKGITLEPGTYTFECVAQGFAGDTVALSILNQSNGSVIAAGDSVSLTGWAVWMTPKVSFTVTETTTVNLQMTIGIQAGGWGTIDCMYLYQTGEYVPVHEHELTYVEAKDPTCEEDGNIAYWYCEKCGNYYADENAETQIEEADTVIPALGHDYQWINEKQPTLFEDGYSGDRVCVRCGDVLETGHVIPATGSAILPVLPSVPSVSKPTAPMSFTDVSVGDWFYDAVEYVYEEGLMNGTSDTKFSPNATLTRGMVVTILHRIEGAPATRYNATFSDVPNYEWYTDGVEWAAKYDIVTGYTTGKFGPEDPVTREQLAAILYRYAEYKGYDVSKKADLSGYTDGANVSEYAKTNVAWAVANGILESTNGKLRPRENAIRAEVALAVAEFHQQYVK